MRRDRDAQHKRTQTLIGNLDKLQKSDALIPPSDIILWEGALASGYGQTGPIGQRATRMMAQMEGLFLDPVYTVKTFAGVIGLLEEVVIHKNMRILFVHSGGLPALFAYQDI